MYVFQINTDNLPYEKVGKNEPVCIADQIPFDIPESWEWVRLKNCCIDIFSGKSPKYIKSETAFHIIGQAANQNTGLDFSQCKYTDADFWNSMDEKYFLRKYDVLLNTLGNGTLGRSGIVTDLPYPTLTDGHLFIFRTNEEVVGWYLYLYLQHRKPEIEKSANGSTNQTFLNLTKTMEWLVPLPSKDEQIRIVEKYKSLTPILEAYSRAYNNCIRLNDTFPELLKKSILQEAVQGKLVPQDPNDEPASVLLERIRAEKQRLIKEGKIKKDKNESIIFRRDNSHYEKLDEIERCIDDEIPFEIPDCWEWIRLGTLFQHNTGKALNSSNSTGKKLSYITTSNLYWDRFELEKLKEMPFTENEMEKCTVTKGDLLVCEGGDIGRAAIWKYDYPIRIQNHIHRLRPYTNISIRFYYYIFYLYKNIGLIGGKGIGIQGLSSNALHQLLFPLPPLQEQNKIVAAIENIIPYCERL